MGCIPFGRILIFGRKHGEGRRKNRRRRGSNEEDGDAPPPMEVMYGRPVARSVIYGSNGPIYVTHPGASLHPCCHQAAEIAPTCHAAAVEVVPGPPAAGQPKSKPGARVRFALPDGEPPDEPEPGLLHPGAPAGYGGYAPSSPVPGTPERCADRRRECFGGDYNYYPTPVREGVYRIATDAGRLTTMFSDENPNACSIV